MENVQKTLEALENVSNDLPKVEEETIFHATEGSVEEYVITSRVD